MRDFGRANGRVGLIGPILATLIAFGGASCQCVTHGSYSKDPDIDAVKNFGVVKEGVLYRGSNPDGLALNQLHNSKYQIKTIVNLNVVNANEDEVRSQGMQYYHFPIVPVFWFRIGGDDTQIKRFLEVVRDPKNWPVFVYDTRGATRVGEAVGVYEIVDEHEPIADVERELYAHHYCQTFHPYIVSYLRDLAHASTAPPAPPAPESAVEPVTQPATEPTAPPVTEPAVPPATEPAVPGVPVTSVAATPAKAGGPAER